VAAVLVAFAPGAPARAASSDWVDGNNVRIRLVATGTDTAGGPNAALEIELAPGWKTYWRSPGDAGVSPAFDFSGSTNLKDVVVGFPPPEREDDGFTVSNIYSDRVVLPFTVEAIDPGKPVDLSMKFDLGVCQEICLPVTLETGVAVERGGADSDAAAVIKDGVAALPGSPDAGKFDVGGVKRTGGDDNEPVFEFQAHVPDPAHTEIFVEGPAGWYPDVPKPVQQGTSASPSTWRFTFDRLGAKTPIAKAPIRFTIVSGGRAIEETVTLD
jgi:suppressor for copper-sensitivity B